MTSIPVHGGPAPHAVLRDAVDWGRVVVATLARGVVVTLLGLALWAAAPAVIGWQPTTVMTGSMEPRLTPGDVVVARPVTGDDVRMGKILLADDPDRPGHLRMHRYVDDGPHRTLVTKGDANPQRDSTPLQRPAVHGIAFLRVPWVGVPIVWIRTGQWGPVGALALAVVGLLALCAVDGSLRRLTGATRRDGDDPGDDDGREARDGAATRLPARDGPDQDRRGLRRHRRRVRRLRRLGGAAAVVVLASGVGALHPASASAVPWSASTGGQTSSFAATTAVGVATLTCTQTTSGTVTIAWTYPGVPASSFDLVTGSTQLATVPGSARSMVYGGSGLVDLGTTYTLNLRTNLGSNWTALSVPVVRIKVVSVLGAATATCA
jgi:signal peptidase